MSFKYIFHINIYSNQFRIYQKMISSIDNILTAYSKKNLQVIFKSIKQIIQAQLTIQQIDYKLKNISMDIQSMSLLVTQLKNNIFNIEYKLQTYQQYGIRFMVLINEIFQLYGIDKFTFLKVKKYIKICSIQWKRLLNKKRSRINRSSMDEIFLYKIYRNNYLYTMLKTNNTILLKMMDRLLSKGYINKRTLKYLRKSNIKTYFELIYSKMIFILEQQHEETGLKILIINQFLKFILFYLNVCLKEIQFDSVFAKFFTVVLYTCRYIKKMQREIRQVLIRECLGLIRQGFNYYIAILKKNKKNFIKIEQLKYIVEIIEEKPDQNKSNNIPVLYQIKDAMPIIVILKILDCWKTVWRNKRRTNNVNELDQMKHLERKNKFQGTSDQNRKVPRSRSLYNKKQIHNDQKVQVLKINKSINNLRRKSLSNKKFDDLNTKNGVLPQLFKQSIKVTSKTLIKNMPLQQSFEKIDAMKLFKNYSINDKSKSQILQQNVIRQLKIQDYNNYKQSRDKSLKNENKIILFKGTCMLDTHYKQKKKKLTLKSTMKEIQQ